MEEVTIYRPPMNLEPCQWLLVFLDAHLQGTRVTVTRPATYHEGQPIPSHALSCFQGNPLDNYNVCDAVPEWL